MEHNRLSRRRKNEKRRSVNRLIMIFSAIALLLLIVLVLVPKFKNEAGQNQAKNKQTETVSSDIADDPKKSTGVADDEETEDQDGDEQSTNTSQVEEEQKEENSEVAQTKTEETKDEASAEQTNDKQKDVTKNKESSTDQGSNSETKIKYDSIKKRKVSSEDPNVIVAYEADWPPVGTSQSEPHDAQYEVDTVDWQEMVQAIEFVTPLDDMIIHWIGNDGPDKAIATVSTEKWDEIYRVYLSWVKHEGWQPTRIEELEWLQIRK